jgi:hypothetical protein
MAFLTELASRSRRATPLHITSYRNHSRRGSRTAVVSFLLCRSMEVPGEGGTSKSTPSLTTCTRAWTSKSARPWAWRRSWHSSTVTQFSQSSLAGGHYFPPNGPDRETLALWLAFLRVRDPFTRRSMEAIADLALRMQASLAATPAGARNVLRERLGRDPTDDEVAEMVGATDVLDEIEFAPHQNDFISTMLESALATMPYFLNRYFSVLRFPEPGLVFCDRPLVLRQHDHNRRDRMGFGVMDADEILLPLDRQRALSMHREHRIGNCVVDDPPGYTVDDFNQSVVANAAEEVYCHPDDEARLNDLKLPEPNGPLLEADGASWVKGRTDGVNAPPVRRRSRRYQRP